MSGLRRCPELLQAPCARLSADQQNNQKTGNDLIIAKQYFPL
jgi:hypothetical protein